MLTTGFRFAALLAASSVLFGQLIDRSKQPPPAGAKEGEGWREAEKAPQEAVRGAEFLVDTGTKIPLSLINSVSTKHSAAGDKIYLETVFPILANGRIVIPPGSYVQGTVTQVTRPGRVKGRGEIYVRFDSLTLPNGVTRDFRGRVGTFDGRAAEDFDREEGKIRGEGNKAGDAMGVGTAAGAGAGIGAIATRGAPMGSGIGAGVGAAAALAGVLLTRGPDAVLAKGTTMEMVLDRTLRFEAAEVEFGLVQRVVTDGGSGPLPSRRTGSSRSPLGGYPGRPF